MILRVIREPSVDGATLGSLYLNGVWQCWTLEDVLRDVKIPGETAIPAGTYHVILVPSPKRHGLLVPLLRDVPNFTAIEIHPGNTPADTLGCLLVGQTRGRGVVGGSVAAFTPLMDKLTAAAAPLTIRIEDPVLT